MKKNIFWIVGIILLIGLGIVLAIWAIPKKDNNDFLNDTIENMKKITEYDILMTGMFDNKELTLSANVNKQQKRFFDILNKTDNLELSGTYEYLFKEDETKTVMNVYYNNEIVTSHEIPFESKEQMSAQDSTLLLDKLVDLLANDKVKCENKTCSYTLKNYDKNNLLLLLSLPTFGLYKDYLDSDDNLTLSYIITETTISEVTFNFTNGQSFKLTFSNFR